MEKTCRQDLVGTIVDWVLVLMLISMIGLGVLVILQQILGRNLRVIRRLFKYQRWFFDPLHHPFDSINDDDEEDEEQAAEAAIAKEYALGGEDVIPLSMGGIRRRSDHFRDDGSDGDHEHADAIDRNGYETEPANDEDVLAWHDATQQSGALSSLGDVELVNTNASAATASAMHYSDEPSSYAAVRERSLSNGSAGLNASMDSDSHNSGTHATDDDNLSARSGMSGDRGSSPPSRRAGSRRFRDPELVDLPNLISTSKVAVPVGMAQQQQGNNINTHHQRPPSRNGSFN